MHFARLDPASGLVDPDTTDADPATSSGMGVDPTSSSGTAFPEAAQRWA
jgi:hypothetical protein